MKSLEQRTDLIGFLKDHSGRFNKNRLWREKAVVEARRSVRRLFKAKKKKILVAWTTEITTGSSAK